MAPLQLKWQATQPEDLNWDRYTHRKIWQWSWKSYHSRRTNWSISHWSTRLHCLCPHSSVRYHWNTPYTNSLGAVQHEMATKCFSLWSKLLIAWFCAHHGLHIYLGQNFLTGKKLRFTRQARLLPSCTLIISSEMTSNKVECTTECNIFDPLFSVFNRLLHFESPCALQNYFPDSIMRSSWEKQEG